MNRSILTLAFVLTMLGPNASETLANSDVLNYQGRIQTDSTDFTGTGQFKFALVTATNAAEQAVAQANVSGGRVVSVTILDGGKDYLERPSVTAQGTVGSGASFRANLSGGRISSISVITGGAGYLIAPEIVVAPPAPNLSFTSYWSNDGTSVAGSEPANALDIEVTDGLFTIGLGDGSLQNMNPFPVGLFQHTQLKLRVWFNDGVDGFLPLHPVQPLSAAPYALGVSDGVISNPQFLGTTDAAPIVIHVNNEPALRLEPTDGAPNIVLGSPANIVDVATRGGVVLGGGGFGDDANTIARSSDHSTISGGAGNVVSSNSVSAVISGGSGNRIGVRSSLSIIAGGYRNEILHNSIYAVISGGNDNLVGTNAYGSVIGGGADHVAGPNSWFTTIAGGFNNRIGNDADGAAILSGYDSTLEDRSGYALISGGSRNSIGINADYSVISGGSRNSIGAGAFYSCIPGGSLNEAAGDISFAAGFRAKSLHDGAFVWADYINSDFSSVRENEFAIRAAGGLRLQSNVGIRLNAADSPMIVRDWDRFDGTAPGGKAGIGRWGLFMEPHRLTLGIPNVAGKSFQVVRYQPDGSYSQLMGVDLSGNLTTTGAINPPSDRNMKQGFEDVDAQEILERVVGLPVQSWTYKESPKTRHIGPVAQDFRSAFGLGMDDKHIATVDADGVALAAIKGLHQQLEEKEERIKALEETVAELKELMSGKK